MTLSMAEMGKELTVNKVIGKDEIRRRLANLGFVAGAQCAVVSEWNGNLIASVKDTRIALDKALCSRIIVSYEQEERG